MDITSAIELNVTTALAEDIGNGDITAQLIPASLTAIATVISRDHATLCGKAWFESCFKRLDSNIHIQWFVQDGDRITPSQKICEISGNARAMLTAERPALNLLQTLSGTATLTRSYVDKIAGTSASILDTRKTLPGLRIAQKYAVLAGGGLNQRIGLYDGILIKENHIAAAGGIFTVLVEARKLAKPGVSIQIEVENMSQLDEALQAGAKLILLDNFSFSKLREAVIFTAKRAVLEASGGITLESVRLVAETGVDRISVGNLTKDVKAVDFSMRFA
ncbi:carboxylating nicotinate-nucleotide diphosphorylase [Sulfurirhabdus autotrophica]|uniref:Probable nicotinate-nucleotide pyrophosphorylase [carboxylating] n=1 Tax=Sulfurirhabdus autotrophica TaxID=1706046 RepID=A0A4R3YGL0_9PROT|nr:carboxylating nicotinate-nucleotide diphosphorylase [Sulfurirhabdus autotrophica]TCV90368.1 nicotinate-nucleotide pyrophosphorylase [carboxylating] [Sulfurirhabdus autotrophica]